MNDSELSLAVAKIIMPDYDWSEVSTGSAVRDSGKYDDEWFNYKQSLGQMAVWYRKNTKHTPRYALNLWRFMDADNPPRAIAEAIVEAENADS